MQQQIYRVARLALLSAVSAFALPAAHAAEPAPVSAEDALPMAAGAAAKLACSGVFVAGRPLLDVVSKDIERVSPLTREINYNLDPERSTITASKAGVTRSALYRPGIGCTLLVDTDVAALRQQVAGLKLPAVAARPGNWPAGDEIEPLPPGVQPDMPALQQALDGAFADDTPGQGIDTRAMIVVLDGRIVAERYAPGYGKDTRFLGWSASKSVLATLVGVLVSEGKLRLDDPAPVPEWHEPGDARREITLSHLLQMSSGLAFSEPYLPGADSTTMLFQRGDMAGFAAAKPLEHKPGTFWAYSSGTTNILSRIVLQATGGTLAGYEQFARTRLFEPAGMNSAVFEPDAKGVFVGSSYLYATARDWARFGLLYLNNGTLNGRKILSPEWVAYAQRRAPANLRADYGAQFWLNGFVKPGAEARQLPDLPADTYMAKGHNRQIVAVVPSRRVVIVRLGWTLDGVAFDANRHFANILRALPETKAANVRARP